MYTKIINIDKDVFEKVIDDLMIERYNKDPEIKEYIESLPKENKRIAILSLIGEDNLLWSRINDILKDRKTGYQRLKKVYELLKDYVKIAEVERKKHGEILTPFKELAEPMVRLVEKYDPEFWKNPNHKVLDSSAGYGTFLILSAYKFMVGLKNWEPDEEKRFKWVVENCLYYGELQARSVFSWLVAIDPYDEYKTNTYYGSFLTEDFDKHAKDVWNVEKWDLIIQNPPYQKAADKSSAATDKPIWHLFVDKSLLLITNGGKMIMVHPSGWRSIKTFSNTKNNLLERNIKYIKMHSFRDGQDMFNAAINFDFYFLENIKYKGITEIVCEDRTSIKMDISNIKIIPSENIKEISSLFAKDGEEKINLISNSAYHTQRNFMAKEQSESNIYPCVYTVKTNHSASIRWSSINDRGHFGIPKVIFARGASGTISDIEGKYGLTEFAYGIVDDHKNIEKIKRVLDSEYFIKNIMLFKNSLGDKYNRKMISQFRKDFWKEFNKNEDMEIKKESILEIGVGISSLCNKYEKDKDGSLWFDESQKSSIRENIRKVINSSGNSLISDLDCDLVSEIFIGEELELVKSKFIKYDICNPPNDRFLKNRFDKIIIKNVAKSLVIGDIFPFSKVDSIFSIMSNQLTKNGEIQIINKDSIIIKNPIVSLDKILFLTMIIDDKILNRNGYKSINSFYGKDICDIKLWNIERMDGKKYQISIENSDNMLSLLKKIK